MELLDLPPELFQHVMHQLVSVVGVRAAWRLRPVCRTFAAEIRQDVVANQPLHVFHHYRANVLFDKVAATVLFNRIVKPLDVDPTIPNKIKDTVEALLQHVSDNTASVRDQYTEALCGVVADKWNLYYHLKNHRSDIGHIPLVNSAVADIDQAAAAFALNNEELINAICARLDFEGFEKSYVFDCPLINLVKYGTRTSLVSQTIENVPGLDAPAARDTLSACVIAAIEKKDISLIKLLVQKYEGTTTTTVDKHTYNNWLLASIRADEVDIVKFVLTIKIKSSPRVVFDRFEAACEIGNKEVVACLLGKGRVDPNQLHYRNSPLRCAVLSCKAGVIQAVLDAGANPSGPIDASEKNDRIFYSPLCAAIQTGQLSLVQLLLDAGATLKAKNVEVNSPLLAAFNRHNRSIYNLIRKAKMESEGIEIPTFDNAKRKNVALIAQRELQNSSDAENGNEDTNRKLSKNADGVV
ncbi:hypothetical protein BDV96DRAFT_60916 [Lophiotrema nucula]|uniref:Uncharacterized protein n=1 Tax=Lophiotrema nucula TaxID=690887 RepID=A0A6A5Z9M7_9PLEO|nr:hypothetical protein BDV96DRAFT_60916 [Lophiotrema nucula]